MKKSTKVFWLGAAASGLLWGCGNSGSTVVTGPDGSKVVSDGSGNAVITGPDGEKLEIKSDGSMSATGKDGKTSTANVNSDGKSVTFSDGKGKSMTLSADSVTEADLGMPFYPGSEGSEGSFKSSNNGKSVMLSQRTTSDDPEKVVAFYKEKLSDPKDMNFESDGNKTCAVTGKLGTREVTVTAVREKDNPKVKIALGVSEK